MYHVFWIGADGAVREKVITKIGELNDWTQHYSRGLGQMFVHNPRYGEWGHLAPDNQWRVVNPDQVPTAIRAYRLITQ